MTPEEIEKMRKEFLPEEWQDSPFHSTAIPLSKITKQTRVPRTQDVEPVAEARAIIARFSDIQPEEIKWLWPGRIALGKLTLIAGDPGLGKSLVTVAIASAVSTGAQWPVDNSFAPCGDVIFLSAEDDAADTIRPRLDAAGANCERVHILQAVQEQKEKSERMFSLKRDIVLLEKVLTSLPDCRLVIIDPVSAYLDGTDSHNNAEVRSLVAPLTALATRRKVAIIAVSHLNKGVGGNAIYRAIGSIAFIASARAGYLVVKDKNNPERRLVLPSKNNLSKDNEGLAYKVVTAQNNAPVVAWEATTISVTVDEALQPSEPSSDPTETDEAIDLLRELSSQGPIKAADAFKQAKFIGIGKKALRTAKEKLSLKSVKAEFDGGWVWVTDEDALGIEDTPPENRGTLANEGHLPDDYETFKNL
jgi:hypothetical protein